MSETEMVLLMNDMRSSKFEELAQVARGSESALRDLIDAESVPAYTDGRWSKGFRKGGPLEWYNGHYAIVNLVLPPHVSALREPSGY